jgi:hypothetical protein
MLGKVMKIIIGAITRYYKGAITRYYKGAITRYYKGAITRYYKGAITRYYKKKAKQLYGIRNGSTGSVTALQYFGSAANLNIHFHILFLEGSYEKGGTNFFRVNAPTDAEVEKLLSNIVARVKRFLKRKGYLKEEGELNPEQMSLLENGSPIISSCVGASVQQKIGLGERAGEHVRRVGAYKHNEKPPEFKGPLCFSLDYFSIHARTHVEPNRRDLLEKLLRYILRPALSKERLSLEHDGNIMYELKTPYNDGTSHILFSPMEFIEKLIAIIPPPRLNLIRYHGRLAPHASGRAAILPEPPLEDNDHDPSCQFSHDNDDYIPRRARAYRLSFAKLLRRVFKIELQCPRCGGKLKIISAILDVEVIRKILTHLKISPDPPSLAPSRFSSFQMYEEILV